MYSQFLPVFMSNARLDAAEMLPYVIRGEVTLRDMLTFCQYYRIAGISALFLQGNLKVFCNELYNSGRAFLSFLKMKDDTDKITSMVAPFFDAIAVNDIECASEIAKNSRMTWSKEEEYEDDFLYTLFLMKHFFLNCTNEECEVIVDQYKTVLEGNEDVRFDICKQFLDNDEMAFDRALCWFLEEQEERYKKLITREAIPMEVAATEACLNVEGLALVRLAEIQGFETQKNYLFIPSIARRKISMVFEPDSWKRPYQ